VYVHLYVHLYTCTIQVNTRPMEQNNKSGKRQVIVGVTNCSGLLAQIVNVSDSREHIAGSRLGGAEDCGRQTKKCKKNCSAVQCSALHCQRSNFMADIYLACTKSRVHDKILTHVPSQIRTPARSATRLQASKEYRELEGMGSPVQSSSCCTNSKQAWQHNDKRLQQAVNV
jgi:hypothetical protein